MAAAADTADAALAGVIVGTTETCSKRLPQLELQPRCNNSINIIGNKVSLCLTVDGTMGTNMPLLLCKYVHKANYRTKLYTYN